MSPHSDSEIVEEIRKLVFPGLEGSESSEQLKTLDSELKALADISGSTFLRVFFCVWKHRHIEASEIRRLNPTISRYGIYKILKKLEKEGLIEYHKDEWCLKAPALFFLSTTVDTLSTHFSA